jgi:hypothetical protein
MVKISMKLAQIIKDILVLSITVSQFLAPMLGIGFGTFFLRYSAKSLQVGLFSFSSIIHKTFVETLLSVPLFPCC